MRRIIIGSMLLLAAAMLLVTLPAQATNLAVEFEPAQVTAGDTFKVEVCDTGGRTVDYRVTQPDGSSYQGQFYANDKCTLDYYIAVPTSLPGVYTLDIVNHSGKVQASGSGTAVAS